MVIFFPKALSTTAGPATSSWAVFLVITLKWEATNLAAGKPATGPKAADITGISLSVSATDLNLDLENTGSPPYPLFLLFAGPATDPPPPSCKRINGIL